ncbi:MAG TPA: phosphoribosylanthranilate isomerase [Fimbriimonadaceae bacterium]|nr:phosphoribosylanthranilate isomerase [Fimbriimonadaceae bacterium]
MTRVKVCGITNLDDLEVVLDEGASAVGFVLEQGSPRLVGMGDIADLLSAVPPYVARVAVMGPFAPGGHLASFDAVQAIGVERTRLEASQRAVAVYRVGSGEPFPDPEEVDAVLLDAFSAGEYGGTGKRIDFRSARAAMAESTRPVIVAGGLDPDNVGEVVKELRPYAVDVSSGVESAPGKKDRGAVRAFIQAVRAMDRQLSE